MRPWESASWSPQDLAEGLEILWSSHGTPGCTETRSVPMGNMGTAHPSDRQIKLQPGMAPCDKPCSCFKVS